VFAAHAIDLEERSTGIALLKYAIYLQLLLLPVSRIVRYLLYSLLETRQFELELLLKLLNGTNRELDRYTKVYFRQYDISC
jgi:hypothetical protein